MKKTLTFVVEKETKGAVRYQESGLDQFAEPTVGTLYMRKSSFKDLGKIPETLTVTIEAD